MPTKAGERKTLAYEGHAENLRNAKEINKHKEGEKPEPNNLNPSKKYNNRSQQEVEIQVQRFISEQRQAKCLL